jgi:AcrR family transcriptional regulator
VEGDVGDHRPDAIRSVFPSGTVIQAASLTTERFWNSILGIQNDVLTSLAETLADRALDERRAAYADEVRRLIDAAYAVMRSTGEIDPRVGDVVRAAGLSNQAFYRHFKSKDELLLAVLTDGQHRLLATLQSRMARVEPGAPRVAAWIEGVMAQARNAEAAENTRPFAINGARIADRFPDEWSTSHERLMAPLREAVTHAGGDGDRDADAIYHLTFGEMEDALKRRTHPSREDVAHLVGFAVKGAGLG